MKLDKITKIEKKVLVVETIFVFGILIYLSFSTIPVQISPLSGMTIIEPDFVFEIENGDEVILSVDENFSNPVILTEDKEVKLAPGVYYWKVKNDFRESDVSMFTVESNVALNLYRKNDSYELRNVGNVDLNVTEKKEGITGGIILEINELKEVKGNATYEGSRI